MLPADFSLSLLAGDDWGDFSFMNLSSELEDEKENSVQDDTRWTFLAVFASYTGDSTGLDSLWPHPCVWLKFYGVGGGGGVVDDEENFTHTPTSWLGLGLGLSVASILLPVLSSWLSMTAGSSSKSSAPGFFPNQQLSHWTKSLGLSLISGACSFHRIGVVNLRLRFKVATGPNITIDCFKFSLNSHKY